MRVDVSEIKKFKGCKRSWELSSRNGWHLTPSAPNDNFYIGTLVHEALHALYSGGKDVVEKVLESTLAEVAESEKTTRSMLTNIINNYAAEYLVHDLERFKVLDIEYGFSFKLDPESQVDYCGSIDMLMLEKATNKIYGFEHKSAKSFRSMFQLRMDEQPRMYTEALTRYIEEYNKTSGVKATLGGIYINQIKKTVRALQVQRDLMTYSDADRAGFIQQLLDTVDSLVDCVNTSSTDVSSQLPEPSYMGCLMCSFSSVCDFYGYEDIKRKELLDEFSEEFEERQEDHLDEKVERRFDVSSNTSERILIEVAFSPDAKRTYCYEIDEPVEIGEVVLVTVKDEVKEVPVVKLGSDYKGPCKKAHKCL